MEWLILGCTSASLVMFCLIMVALSDLRADVLRTLQRAEAAYLQAHHHRPPRVNPLEPAERERRADAVAAELDRLDL